MSTEHRLTELASGVRVVTEAMPSVRSVSLGVWIGTGSVDESEAQAGLSHLLEHLLFKGSERYGSQEIDELFDAMGAELNAGTGKEATSVYARVLDDHLERALDVMGEMVFRPALRDVDSEREVILEEIAMYEDDPQDKVFDLLGRAVFGSHPLGRAIIGRAEVVAGTPVEQIAAFHSARYRSENVVVAAAGSLEHDELVALVESRVPDRAETRAAQAGEDSPLELARRTCFERKDTEQYHVCFGAPGLARDDERRYALRVLDTIFGGTSSSRLFQEIREQRGLAYAVYSFSSHHARTGQVGIYLGTRGENLASACEVTARELEKLREAPATSEELARAKENLKGRMVLSLESTAARMNRLGSSVLANLPLLSIEETIARVDAVEIDDLAALARELFAPERLSIAGIGPDSELFDAALGSLAPAVAEPA